MDDEQKTEDTANEGDPEWRRRMQETNELADELAPPAPSGGEDEGTGPFQA
jgi:hypothetical protein